jgi:hypothetical protein
MARYRVEYDERGFPTLSAVPPKEKTTFEQRLGQLVRLLNSSNDGEVMAAVKSLGRVLQSNGRDIHWLADLIERPKVNGSTSMITPEEEAQRIYQRGREDERKEFEARQSVNDDFRNLDGTVSWHGMAVFCLDKFDRSAVGSKNSLRTWLPELRSPAPPSPKTSRIISSESTSSLGGGHDGVDPHPPPQTIRTRQRSV